MRKLIIIILVVLLIVLGISAVTKGLKIGGIELLSISQIKDKNSDLDSKIEAVNSLIDTEYPKKLTELKKADTNMQNAKEEYLKYTSLSTDSEILEAMQVKSYAIEFLWAKLGTHAKNEEVILTFQIVSGSVGKSEVSDIKFTVNGTYTDITNFIYAIENDPDLNFRIENFKLVPYSSEVVLSATFTVKNVIVGGNTSKASTSTSSTTNTDENTNSSTTNTTKNTNTSKSTNTNTTTENTSNTNTTSTNTVAE